MSLRDLMSHRIYLIEWVILYDNDIEEVEIIILILLF